MIRASRRRKSAHQTPEISLTPLIDTALVLLVIFMIATPMMQNSLKVNLPKGYMKEDQQETAQENLVVAINQDLKADEHIIALNGKKVSFAELVPAIEQKIGTKKDQKIYIECDEKVRYGFLFEVADKIKYLAGVEHVILSAQKA